MCRERLSIGRSPAYTYTVTKRHPWDTSHYEKDGPFEVPKGWAWSDIGFLCSKIGSGATPRGSNYSISGIPFFRSQNIYNDGIDLTDIKYISPETHQSMISTEVLPNDLLLNITGGSLGRCAIVPKVFYKGNVSQHVCILRTIKVLPRYLHCVVLSSFFSKHMETSGSGREGLPKYSIEKMLIPVPPIQEQQRIVDEVAVWMKIVSHLETSVFEIQNNISAMRAKILDLAIHGKLVPQDPSDEPAIDFLRRINPSFTPSHNLHYGDTLPKGWTCSLYGELNQHQNKSEDPTAFPEETYELYSVPIYDTGMPEFRLGAEIGSTKQLVDKGDVLLCKINPHLNRSWVVSHHRFELKCIASSEWLVFHNDAVIPEYARLFFMSPPFKELMLSNVSGVGGSLMRARSSTVNSYPIWVPPINEQKRIINLIEAFYSVLDGIEIGLCE